ncbi:M15 family metallopeptidase [Promicromonospora sp. NPDC057138]|uniref:M15 family metallopeptidase n=1 Tax=Promicromonospora sp. NPDC057138 TaxID=3346031 RepID=UPI00362786A7
MTSQHVVPPGERTAEAAVPWLATTSGADHREIVLLSDPRVGRIPVAESGEPLVELDETFGAARAPVRAGLARRLRSAQEDLLAEGLRLEVVEGHRHPAEQQRIIDRYSGEVLAEHPGVGLRELEVLTSRFVSPIAVAPHVAGAAVDLTLADADGPLDMGTAIDATPEMSGGRCYFGAPDIEPEARALRGILARALGVAGLVNYPTEWWHWSYGDRYWALVTGARSALYGPVVS